MDKHDEIRRAQLGLIHAAKKALALDEDTYRAMLQAQCNVTSAAKLDKDGRDKVINYLRTQGWQPPARPAPKRRREAAPAASRVNLWKKIDAQLFSMNLDRTYLDGKMRSQLGKVSAWEFADETILLRVIAALAYQQKRAGAKTK